MRCLCLLLLLAQGAPPPVVESVENAASHIPATLPGGGIPAGTRAVIHGARFGADPSQVRVTIGPRNAQILSVRDNQIELLWPPATGPITVTVGATRASSLPPVSPDGAPGLFAAATPARRGAPFTLRGSGGLAAPQTRIYIGASPASILGRRALSGGIEEVVIQIPATAPLACTVPITAIGANHLPGNTILVPVTAHAEPCVPNPWEQLLKAKGPTGLLLLSRSVQSGSIVDDAVGLFVDRQTAADSPLPAPGSCALFRAADAFNQQSPLLPQIVGRLPDPAAGHALDAGPRLTLSTGNQARALNPRSPGFYTRTMGGSGEPAFLHSGAFRLSAPGGKQVQPFTLTLPAPQPFEVHLPPAQSTVNRTQGLTIRWTPGSTPPLFVALLTATDRQNRALAACLCAAPATAGVLHMPAWLLQGLPPNPTAGLAVTALPHQPLTWKAAGLETTAAWSAYVEATPIVLR
jgi:hypothetical protein